jgi:Spy/CpxP family protein refolding chaperone
MLLYGAFSATLVSSGASSDGNPVAGIKTKHKLSPDAAKAKRLTWLKNQVDLSPDQEAKVKPIIDKYVDSHRASAGNRAKMVALKSKFDSDINAVLTPEQQKKLAAAENARLERLKAAIAAAAASRSPTKSN